MEIKVKLFDLVLEETFDYPTQLNVVEHIRRDGYSKLTPSVVSRATRMQQLLYNRYFVCRLDKHTNPLHKPKYETEVATRDGWYYLSPGCAQEVLVADKVLPFYDEDKFDWLERKLKKEGCRVFFDLTDEDGDKKSRKKCRIEIYKVFKRTPFKEKIEQMEEIIHKYIND